VLSGLSDAGMLPLLGGKIVRELGSSVTIGERELGFDVNVGLASYPNSASSSEDLFHRAEQALRSARASAQPWVVDEPATRPADRNSWRLELELQGALSHNQLRLWYQPRLDLRSGRPGRPEALLRWESAQHGAVSPARLLPMIEQSGRSLELVRWALNTALRQCRRWGDLGVAINVAAAVLAQAEAPEMFVAALRIWSVAPSLLTIEVSETGLLPDTEACVRQLQPLRDAGIRISIDDFGTGHTSLQQFRRLPADELKIDRCFITNLLRDEADRAICEHVIALAHRFRMGVVAEGVEDQPTLSQLQRMGCDAAQGYRIARPMPDDALVQWLGGFDSVAFR